MRRSKPGQIKVRKRNLENKNEKPVEIGQKTTPRHFRRYPMLYGKSPVSGRRSGGFYWNPPADCHKRVMYSEENGERWIDVGICRACERHKKNDCEAYAVKCGYKEML